MGHQPGRDLRDVRVPGGYRVTGRQGFSTGCRHAAWQASHAQVFENGQLRLLPDGQPETRYLFVPVAEAERLDTWQVRGMRGTGTHHFAVHDVFVPEARTVLSTAAFASGDAAVALGVARSAIDAFVELAGAKTPRSVIGLLRDQPLVQSDIGHAEAYVRTGRAFLTETVRDIWAHLCATGTISLDQRATLRLATTHAIRLAVQVVDIVYNAAGATAVYESHVIQRHFQDIHVISQHIQSRLANYELVGRHWLGLAVDETRL